jgi:hypothetical protein
MWTVGAPEPVDRNAPGLAAPRTTHDGRGPGEAGHPPEAQGLPRHQERKDPQILAFGACRAHGQSGDRLGLSIPDAQPDHFGRRTAKKYQASRIVVRCDDRETLGPHDLPDP